MQAIDLKALGIYTGAEVKTAAKARVLIVAPPKIGKTCALATAPKPFIINCDGKDATVGATNIIGPGYMGFDVTTIKTWNAAIEAAKKVVAAGAAESVCIDTLTLLGDNILDQLKARGSKEFTLWNEFDTEVRLGIKELLKLDAHILATAHMYYSHEDGAGVLPAFPGQGKNKIPGMFHEWILMTCDPLKNPMRQFVLVHDQLGIRKQQLTIRHVGQTGGMVRMHMSTNDTLHRPATQGTQEHIFPDGSNL